MKELINLVNILDAFSDLYHSIPQGHMDTVLWIYAMKKNNIELRNVSLSISWHLSTVLEEESQ